MKMFDVYGCAAVDLQDNLVKPSNNGDLIPVSMGLGTITDIDQSFMGANISIIQRKYDNVIFVCGINVFKELKAAGRFLDYLGERSTFVVTGDPNNDISVHYYNKMTSEGSWFRGKDFKTGLNPKSDQFKQAVERVITSLSYSKKTAVVVMGGRSCYHMFTEDYEKFFVSQIKQNFSGVKKTLELPQSTYCINEYIGVYEDDDIKQFALTRR